MLRHLKKFTVYSSVIVAGQASRALDDAPFAGQDESEDAKGLLRLLSECEDVQIFGDCYDPATTKEITSHFEHMFTGPIPTEIGQLAALTSLRVPPASPTPGAARDRPSASQEPLHQQDRRPAPDRDRPAHEAGSPASSPLVPDARRAARPTFGVAGTSTTTRSPARSRPRSASSRR